MLSPEVGKCRWKCSASSGIQMNNRFVGKVPVPKHDFEFLCLFSINQYLSLPSWVFLFPLALPQHASAMGTPTLVILTWLRGWRRAIAAAASVTTASTTRKGSTASAASWASTATSGGPSLPQTPANVSQQPRTTEGLLKGEIVKPKVRSSCRSLEQSSCFTEGLGALWILFVILLAKSSGDICRVKVYRCCWQICPKDPCSLRAGEERWLIYFLLLLFLERKSCILFSCSPCLAIFATSEWGSSASRGAADK